jgi:pyruvate dehydrogenase E2 component (dihydrolipoamide acetyltransferase)
MPTEFKIPELGENVTAGDVVRILVKAGDTIEKDQPVLELETDKATIEVPSSVAGTVQEIKVKPGDKVSVGQTVLTLDAGKDGKDAQDGKEAKKEAAPKAGTGKAAAGRGQKGGRTEEKPREAQADKPKPQPAGAAEDGGLSQAAEPKRDAREAAPKDEQQADQKPRQEDEEGEDAEEVQEAAEEAPRQKPRGEVVDINRGARSAAAAATEAPQGPPPPAAPSVRRLARELGVDIRRVSGSGPAGRISVEDVQAYVRTALTSGGAAGAAAPAAQALPDFTRWGDVERKPLSNIRRKTAQHLGHAWNVIPHVTQHDRTDITAMEGLRKRFAPQADRAGGKLTMTAIALKIVAGALQRFPQFNSSIDVAGNEIVYKSAIHVGVAVDTPRGLLVPVIRDVDQKGILDLARDLAQASEKARTGKLALEEMQGGGFTITNLGGIGGTSFTPIVNWPEVAILGISRASWDPVWRPGSVEGEGAFEPRLMLPLSLSYDHRVIDGADAARFLRWVCDAFEQPFVLAL